MKVGDLISPVIPNDAQDLHQHIQPYLMQVLEIAKTGINVVVLSGPHLGCEVFYPSDTERQWRIISRI